MEFLQIHDPRKPGDYLVIARRDFDPAVHVPRTAAPDGAPVPEAAPPADTPKKKARPTAAKE